MQDYVQKVIHAISLVLDNDDVSELHSGTRIERDLGFDSGLYIELIMYLEDTVEGLHIDPATLEISNFESVGSIAKFIANATSSTVVA
ncbi:Acyl carrier protein [Xenorhabdus vietnamensis]|uniref:Acyl carrier protein n=1 Tax=Xenorhabdus vietnamensis TaxID=351656 RepID=A0A1Y2S798_9GAMM|nr:phosphopantetheine-binding protein [Xenorhabdus vietnamensis]OTA14532.1 Acyl carrier protein [Xenorhabdus vietnamensis]